MFYVQSFYVSAQVVNCAMQTAPPAQPFSLHGQTNHLTQTHYPSTNTGTENSLSHATIHLLPGNTQHNQLWILSIVGNLQNWIVESPPSWEY
jgi:hypothetical protein